MNLKCDRLACFMNDKLRVELFDCFEVSFFMARKL